MFGDFAAARPWVSWRCELTFGVAAASIDPERLRPTSELATIGPRQRTKNFLLSGVHGMIEDRGFLGKAMPHQNRVNDCRFPLMVRPAR
jgi:hypothetical protein